jgi:hypothetical protein
MAEYSRSRDTSAPADAVWALWSDTATWPSWNPDVTAMQLDGPFLAGTTGKMTTTSGVRAIKLVEVSAGHGFALEAKPVPLTTFTFRCEIDQHANGARISQSVALSGPLAPVLSMLMGNRIAATFEPVLAGLADAAERRAAG